MNEAEKRLAAPVTASLLALLCCALWGSAFSCIKIGYRLFEIAASDTASIILFAGTRFALAGVLTILAGSLLQRRPLLPSRSSAGGIAALAAVQTLLQYVTFYLGLAYTTSVRSSIISGMSVFFSIFISALAFRYETLSGRKILGCLVGFGGIVIMNLGGAHTSGELALLGDALVLLSQIASAWSSSLIKLFSRRENPVLLSGWQFLTGGGAMMLVGACMGGSLRFASPGCFGILLWLSVVSAAAYTLWGVLLKYNPVSRITVFTFSTPIFGVLLSALLLGETGQAFRPQSLAALALVCGGILIINRTPRSA